MTIDAVIFDLDGTLTAPILDFDLIRRELGIQSGPVWEALADMPAWLRARNEAILLHHELAAARASQLNPGTHQVTAALREAGIKQAILTRNCRRSVNITLQKHGLSFDAVITREDDAVKPSPKPVIQLCHKLQVRPQDCLMVGDYLFDVQSGKAAGAVTALLCHSQSVPPYADLADHVIHRLEQILELV